MHLSPDHLLLFVILTAVTVTTILAVSRYSAFAARNKWKQTALILIDIQNDYFKGGAMELEYSDRAGQNAGKLLKYFRKNGIPVIHVRHENTNPDVGFFIPGTDGARIHTLVAPEAEETIILKHYPDSFMETDLDDVLNKMNITHLVIGGMQSDVCIRTTSLKALKKNYTVTVAEDTLAAVNQAAHKSAVEEISGAGAVMTSSALIMKR